MTDQTSQPPSDAQIVSMLQEAGEDAEEAQRFLRMADIVLGARIHTVVDAVLAQLPPPEEPPAPDQSELMVVEKLALGSATNPEKDAALKQAAADFKAALAMPDEPPTGGS